MMRLPAILPRSRLVSVACVLLIAHLLFALVSDVQRVTADVTGACGNPPTSTTIPFNDVTTANLTFFCGIAEAFFSGLTTGTTATTFTPNGPNGNVTREQMAVFVSRTLDQSVKRGSR